MALTVQQQPNKLNCAYTNLIYVVDSSNTNLPQYQYVMDVVSGSQQLARIRQYPNPNGVAVFDPHKIISDYIEYSDVNYTDITSPSQIATSSLVSPLQFQSFQIKFGEEYGSSPSSSVTLYNGNGAVGSPAVTGSNGALQIFPGVIDQSDPSYPYFNWYTGSRNEPGNQGRQITWHNYFTTQPYITLSSYQSDDQMTIAYDDNAYIQYLFSGSVADPTLTVIFTALNSSGGTVNNVTKSWTYDKPTLVSIPISPRQIGLSQANWDNTVRINIEVFSDPGTPNFNIYKDLDSCEDNYERVTINFINQYGAWDFYGFTLPSLETINVDRQTYSKPFVDWSTSRTSDPNLVNYNPRIGGDTIYNTSSTRTITVTTPYLSQTKARHVEQIFTSPKVLLKYKGENNINAVAAVVTDRSFVRNTNSRGQKLFQYTFNFELGNGPIGR